MGNEVTFLLVEDDEVDVMILKRAFKELKIANELVVCHNGIEALEILRGGEDTKPLQSPYIVLLDLNMPLMNGLEFLEQLRLDERLTRTIVFVMTTSNDEKDKYAAYEKHVAGYILKSDPGRTFMAALEMLDQYWRIVELPAA